MGSSSIIPLTLSSAPSSLTSLTSADTQLHELSSFPNLGPLVTNPFESLHFWTAAPPVNGWQHNHPGSGLARSCPYPDHDRSTLEYTSGQDMSVKGSGPFKDTRQCQWSPLTSLAASYATHATSETHVTNLMTSSRASPHAIPVLAPTQLRHTTGTEAVFSGFKGAFAPRGTPAATEAPELPHPQVIPDLNSGYPSPITQHHASFGTNVSAPHFPPGYQFQTHQLDPPICPTSNAIQSSPSGSIEGVTNFVYHEHQAPVVVYQPPERTRSGRRHCQRACAINIEGLWIDKDDLYTGAAQGGGMISVHECQWAKSSNPCGMWIVGSRSRVGTHIRKWHRHGHADSRVNCLWDGCTTSKAMLKDSINRHVVTVHLEEGFLCHGCGETFSRKDPYDKHVESDEECRDAGVAIVYGTERRVIDSRQALQRGDAVRYAGR